MTRQQYDSNGHTPLTRAAAAGDLAEVERLIVAGNDVNTPNKNGHTPLMEASISGKLEMVKHLVEKRKVNPNVQSNDEYGYTALHCAAQEGHLNVVDYFIVDRKMNPDILSRGGLSPLVMAATKDKLEVVKLLEAHNADLNLGSNRYTVMHYAAEYGSSNVISYLAGKEGGPDIKDAFGHTPLQRAMWADGHKGRASRSSVAALLEEGAYPSGFDRLIKSRESSWSEIDRLVNDGVKKTFAPYLEVKAIAKAIVNAASKSSGIGMLTLTSSKSEEKLKEVTRDVYRQLVSAYKGNIETLKKDLEMPSGKRVIATNRADYGDEIEMPLGKHVIAANPAVKALGKALSDCLEMRPAHGRIHIPGTKSFDINKEAIHTLFPNREAVSALIAQHSSAQSR